MTTINQSEEPLQAQSEEIERFALFQFPHKLGNGVKSRIKSHGCNWNSLFHGWLCPFGKQKEVQMIIEEAKLNCDPRIVTLPKGMIPSDSKIAGRQTRLQILEEQVFKDERQLLGDIYLYNSDLRPEDFAQLQIEEGKSNFRIEVEREFHRRWIALQGMKEDIDLARKELTHLNTDPGDKILDHNAPLLVADSLIQQNFLHQGNRTLQYCSDAFWSWNGIQYVELKEVEIRQTIYAYLRDAKEINRNGHLESFNPDKYKVDLVIDVLRAVCFQRHHPANGAVWLDGRENPDPKYLISFSNGIVNIVEWLENPMTPLIKHTPLLLNVNSITFNFDPCAPEPTAWLQFLNAIWPNDLESQQVLQEWAGYLLTQDTRLHKILLMVGPPRSGKGTIGRIFRELLGYFNVAGPTLSSLSGEFGLQPFLNMMLALISDARLNKKGNNSLIIERLLSISGEDPLTINRKFLPPLTVQLPTRIMMISNELPDLRDSSGALASRYLVLTLQKSWLGNEDTSLFFKLKSELPGILLWALQGLVQLQKRGSFVQPKSSAQTIEELEAMTSPIKAFVAERCEIKPHARIAIASLFDEWCSWCSSAGHSHPGNVQSFGKNLKAAFPQIGSTRPQEDHIRDRCYLGVSIASVPSSSADVRGR